MRFDSRASVAAAVLLALAACGDLPKPFAPQAGEVNDLLRLRDPAGVVVQAPAELPEPAQKPFTEAMVAALQKLDVPASAGAGNVNSFRLAAQVIDRPAGPDREVTVHWRLTDAAGQPAGDYLFRKTVDDSSWQHKDLALLMALARGSAPGVAALLSDRRAATPPVALDPRTPRRAQQANIVPPPRTGTGQKPLTHTQLAQAVPPGKPDVTPKTGTNGQFPPVAIRPIEGAPGDGDAALRRALTHFFTRASIPVVSEHEDPAAIVVGKVTIRPVDKTKEDIRIEWTVYRPDGRRLGAIGQQNTIPAGQLSGKWGDTATAIAEGAVEGIADLFNQVELKAPQ